MTEPLGHLDSEGEARINQLAFLLTYKCTSECRHCCYSSSPRKDSVMLLEDGKRYLRELKSNYPIKVVSFVGGEPFLYFELLVALIEEATRLQIPNKVLTNGFWGKNEFTAKEYAERLKCAGLNELHVSVTAYHQEFTPVDAVRSVFQAAKKAVIEEVNDEAANSLKKTKWHEDSSEEFDTKDVSNPPWMVGRAIDKLAKYFPMFPVTEVPVGVHECHLENKDTVSQGHFEIDPDGFVSICPGIVIGNARETSISDIVRGDACKSHPLLSIFPTKGLKGLLSLHWKKVIVQKIDMQANAISALLCENFCALIIPTF